MEYASMAKDFWIMKILGGIILTCVLVLVAGIIVGVKTKIIEVKWITRAELSKYLKSR